MLRLNELQAKRETQLTCHNADAIEQALIIARGIAGFHPRCDCVNLTRQTKRAGVNQSIQQSGTPAKFFRKCRRQCQNSHELLEHAGPRFEQAKQVDGR